MRVVIRRVHPVVAVVVAGWAWMSRDIGWLEALTMQFGKTLIGAIIGAALGIGLLVVVYLQFGIDKMWLAIPVALLTGLGVRMMLAGSGRASYARGALTVLIALAAYLGGLQITKAVASNRSANATKAASRPADAEQPGTPAASANPETAPGAPGGGPEKNPVGATPRGVDEAVRRPQMPGRFSTWDFLALAVAALVAYELGRGTGGIAGSTATSVPSEPMSVGSHPDA